MPSPGEKSPQPALRAQDRLGHARVLAGLRGVAVLTVVGHNLDLPWMQGGFFGVDIFFALSGFLITTLLLEDHAQHGSVALREFFHRRFLRLYPALVVLVAASAFSSLLRHDVSPERVALVAASTLTYFSNWLQIYDHQAWVGGLSHTWSLAVEVHFYLLWAVTLALAIQRWGLQLKPLVALALGIAVTSELWRVAVWASQVDPAHAYAGTDTRLDSLFLGVVAALFRFKFVADPTASPVARLTRRSVRTIELLIAIGIGWLICQTPQFSPVALLGGFGLVGGATALVILTTLSNPHSILAGPLQTRALGWFGQISYSLYLWHVPAKKIITASRMARFGQGPWLVDVARVLASIALALASYYCIERVFRRPRREPSSAAAVAM